jgi:hypothetical protein
MNTPRPLIALAFALATPLAAQEADDYPKLGPDAVSVTDDFTYLRSADAPDYWAFAPFVKPQFTTSACSIATVTAALNGLTGLPAWASETVMSQPDLLEITGNTLWAELSAEGGDGVTFAQLEAFSAEAVAALDLPLAVAAYQPGTVTDATTAEVRALLAANEASADDALLIYFNQGVVTGDWDGPHISLIGAYDAAADRVLILEVDQDWYVPYWTPLPVLMEAMVKPTSAEHGPLEGEIGGLVRIGPPAT